MLCMGINLAVSKIFLYQITAVAVLFSAVTLQLTDRLLLDGDDFKAVIDSCDRCYRLWSQLRTLQIYLYISVDSD